MRGGPGVEEEGGRRKIRGKTGSYQLPGIVRLIPWEKSKKNYSLCARTEGVYYLQFEQHNPRRRFRMRIKTKKRSKNFMIKRSGHSTGSLHIKISKKLEELWRRCIISP